MDSIMIGMPLFVLINLAKKWFEPDLTDAGIDEVISYELPS
jgi:hypothetical protein